MKISLIIPVYNEEASIAELCTEATEVLSKLTDAYEIILIDDGSNDDTPHELRKIAKEDSHMRHIELMTNTGKSRAYMIGFQIAQGEVIVTADGDLQDDLHEIPKMLAVYEQGYDLVVGWKSGRFKNEPQKAAPSYIFNFLIYLLFGLRLHDSNSGFRVMCQAAAKSLKLHAGIYRFIPELAHLNGYRVIEVLVNHRKRKYGESKYGPTRFLTGIWDILSFRFVTAFAKKPLHFFGTIATILFMIGGGIETYALIQKLMGSSFQTHVAAIIVGALFVMASLQMLTVGLIGELLAARVENESEKQDYIEVTSTIRKR